MATIRGEVHRLDGRTDIWSMGVVFYELLTGQRPFSGETQRELFDEIERREVRPLRQVKPTIPKRKKPLKGGTNRPTGGAQMTIRLPLGDVAPEPARA